jgi:hypothetical protein
MLKSPVSSLVVVLIGALGASVMLAAPAQAQTCQCLQSPGPVVGTVLMPPVCVDGYEGTMQIATGLVGGTIQMDVQLKTFVNVVEGPGGGLGGTTSSFTSAALHLQMSGTGALAGFNRTIQVPIGPGQMDWAARVPGSSVQVFAGELVDASGSILGDPDFDSLSFTCGTGNGFTSSGSSALQRDGGPGSDFYVDSFFELEYEFSFTGAPGSLLDGMGGTHTDTTHLAICNKESPPVPAVPVSISTMKAVYRE